MNCLCCSITKKNGILKFYSGELNVFLIKMVNVCNFSDVGRLAVC